MNRQPSTSISRNDHPENHKGEGGTASMWLARRLNDPEVRAAFANHGVEPEPGSPEALGARIRDDVKKWRDVITSAGIREN